MYGSSPWPAFFPSTTSNESPVPMDSNNPQNEETPYQPVYRAKPLSRTIMLRWQDRNADGGGALQYSNFSFNTRDLDGFNTLRLMSVSFNPNYFSNIGAYVCVGISQVNSATAVTSADTNGTKQLSPTFIVPNSGLLYAASANIVRNPNWVNLSGFDEGAATNVRGLDMTNFTVLLGDENLKPYTYNSYAGADVYYCTLVFRAS